MSVEWEAPAVVLGARSHGESDALVTVMTEGGGVFRGLARGGGGRRQAALWQPGNLVQASWVARLAEQLGTLTAEPVRATAAMVMDDPLALLVVAASCAVAAEAVPEREAHPILFGALVGLLDGVARDAARDAAPVATLVRWEAGLLRELGYGLDLSCCAVTGVSAGLRYVSPRTGRAVSAAAAGEWAERLLPLPGFLCPGREDEAGTPVEWAEGLGLTAHFLRRDALAPHGHTLPSPRLLLADRVAALVPTAASS